MVMLGGLATYVDPKSSPARVGMGITTVLTVSTVIQGIKQQLPAVSYLTALDIYLWVCFFFVSLTLVEYAYLNYQTVVLPRYLIEEEKGAKLLQEKASHDNLDSKEGFEECLFFTNFFRNCQ